MKTNKQVEEMIEQTLNISYQYLLNVLAINNISKPKIIDTLEKYTKELNKFSKIMRA